MMLEQARKERINMTNQRTRVVIAAPTYGSPIHISMVERFKKMFKPEEMAEAAYNMVVNQRDEILSNPLHTIFNVELVVCKSA